MEAYKFKKSLQIVGHEVIDQNPEPTPLLSDISRRIPTKGPNEKVL